MSKNPIQLPIEVSAYQLVPLAQCVALVLKGCVLIKAASTTVLQRSTELLVIVNI